MSRRLVLGLGEVDLAAIREITCRGSSLEALAETGRSLELYEKAESLKPQVLVRERVEVSLRRVPGSIRMKSIVNSCSLWLTRAKFAQTPAN